MSMPPPPPPPPSFPTGPSAGGAAGSTSASFGSRFLAFFIDSLVQGSFTLPGYILLAAGADAIGSLLVFAGFVAFFWNRFRREYVQRPVEQEMPR